MVWTYLLEKKLNFLRKDKKQHLINRLSTLLTSIADRALWVIICVERWIKTVSTCRLVVFCRRSGSLGDIRQAKLIDSYHLFITKCEGHENHERTKRAGGSLEMVMKQVRECIPADVLVNAN